jgi:hypothetical protein
MKGLDGSNPSLPANQSLDLPYILEKPETSREMRTTAVRFASHANESGTLQILERAASITSISRRLFKRAEIGRLWYRKGACGRQP